VSPRRIPIVIDGHLLTNAGESRASEVGSQAWFAWLGDASLCSFSYQTPQGAITVRPEKERQGWYWYAYHATQGALRKAYLDKADAVTPRRLREVAASLIHHQSGERPLNLTPVST
jgi:LuxR family maltose regulon positive regulatory protein